MSRHRETSRYQTEEGYDVFDLISRGDADDKLLRESVKAMDTAEGVSGEMYIKYKELVDRVFNEDVVDGQVVEQYHKTNSTGLVDAGNYHHIEEPSQLFRKFRIEAARSYFYKNINKNRAEEKEFTPEELLKEVRDILVRRQRVNLQWAEYLGTRLSCIRDYWGYYVGHRANLKPIDFARVLTDQIDVISSFLLETKITDKIHPSMPDDKAKELSERYVTDFKVKKYILLYMKAHPDYIHSSMQVALDLIDSDNTDDSEEG